MKYVSFFFWYYFIIFSLQAQTPPSYALTITPSSNTQDVKGNIKASGLIEGSALKSSGLATGNPFLAYPVYANATGDLITGYKVGYLSIPSSAFVLNYQLYNDENETDLLPFPAGDDYLIHSAGGLTFYSISNGRILLAPIQVPHKSKLTSIKLTFLTLSQSRTLNISIIRAHIDNTSNEESIFSFTTPTTNSPTVVAQQAINNLELDNQNYLYTLKVTSSDNTWPIVIVRGAIIEYHDF
ncbi:hypothetical protein [Emticicia sp. C21]|uniref:hypothetical protein n=1 Tax=Emticicia sp. C21 TaxID=2302915 RepID=UPI000E3457DF|nr:hypothetical protein [Emticicia sp. C21]RFS13559.1 hypothetical protein D0T08_25790 [Emticicia sp. C21]